MAVVGGFFALDQEDPDQGKAARSYASELGQAFAKAGFGLVVYFSNDKSLEPHVVSGYVKALPKDAPRPCIDVRYSQEQRGKVRFAEQQSHDNLFAVNPFPSQNWEAPFFRSLVELDGVDAVILVAGDKTTLAAGQIAIGRGLPLLAIDQFSGSARVLHRELAIDQFSGSARVLHRELATRIRGYPSSDNSTPTQLVEWLKERHREQAEARQRREAERRAYARMVDQRRGTGWFLTALVSLVLVLACGMVVELSPSQFVGAMGAALVTAGASGALIRGLFAPTVRLEPRLACGLGVLAGIVVGFAYLIPQLIGAPGLLEPGATEVGATSKIQLLSATVIALTAGIGFDTVFRRIQQRADDVPVDFG